MSTWTVEYAEEFEPEYLELVVDVRVELTAQAKMIERFGPTLGRPRVDTLNGSKHKNMKELRFDAAGGYGVSPSPSTRGRERSFW